MDGGSKIFLAWKAQYLWVNLIGEEKYWVGDEVKMMTVYCVFAMQLNKHIQWQTLAGAAKMFLTMAWINIRCCTQFAAFQALSKTRWALPGKCGRNNVSMLGKCKHLEYSPQLLCCNIFICISNNSVIFYLLYFHCTSRNQLNSQLL